MTNLSPAAQAVLDAAMTTPIVLGCYTATRSHQIAAALRAAVLHLSDTNPWPGHIESTGVNWSSNKLLAIADELEGQP